MGRQIGAFTGSRVCPLARIGYSSERTPVLSLRARASREQADVAQLVAHHLAKVRVAGSNPVVRSRCRKPSREPTVRSALRYQSGSVWGWLLAEWPSGLGKGLQSPLRGFDSRFRLGRLAQRESASLTRKRSLVQSQYRPPAQTQRRGSAAALRGQMTADLTATAS